MLFCLPRPSDTLARAVRAAVAVHSPSALRALLAAHGKNAFATALSQLSARVLADALSMLPAEERHLTAYRLSPAARKRLLAIENGGGRLLALPLGQPAQMV